jgi:hypothetical protein
MTQSLAGMFSTVRRPIPRAARPEQDRQAGGETGAVGLGEDERVELARLRRENAGTGYGAWCPQALRGRVGDGGDE